MPRKKFAIALAIVVALAHSGFALAKDETYTDKDWNMKFYSNCGFPIDRGKSKSLRKIRLEGDRRIYVTLRPGDVGKCSTDAKPRNRAAYWERAEIKQKKHLTLGKPYQIDFSFQVIEGFEGEREGFFQIHAHDKNCWSYPPLMLTFNRGALTVRVLRKVTQTTSSKGSKGSHKSFRIAGYSPNYFKGELKRVSVRYDTGVYPGRVSVAVDGNTIVNSVPIEIAACGKPHIKFGIYRPGKGTGVSTAVFDDLILTPLN